MHKHWRNMSLEDFDRADRNAMLILNAIHRNINLSEQSPTLVKRLYLGFAKISAVVMIPLLMGIIYYYHHKPAHYTMSTPVEIKTPTGATARFTLPDGSQVRLNADSKITYNTGFKNQALREVSVTGEAYFDVTKDEEHPFIVKTQDNFAVKVLGTSFNVQAYDDNPEISVALIEGKVKLFKYVEGKTIELAKLEPNQMGVYNKQTQQICLHDFDNIERALAGKRGELFFDNEPLSTVINQLSRKYGIDIDVQNKALLKRRITATFTNQNLDEALRILSYASPLSYRIIKQNDNKQKVIIK